VDDLIATTTIHNNSVERKPNPDPQDFLSTMLPNRFIDIKYDIHRYMNSVETAVGKE